MKWILASSAVLLIAVLAALVANRMPPAPSLPQPNGYDDILRAGSLVAETTKDYRTIPEVELRQLVSTNTPALKESRIGLARECRVPVERSDIYIDQHMSNLGGIKRLAFALGAEGRLAEFERRTNDAARSYLDAIHLGHQIVHGGLLIDGLVGLACESIGVSALTAVVSGLNAQQCRAAIKELELIDARRELPEDVLRNERKWSRRNYGFISRIVGFFALRSILNAPYQRYLTRYQAEAARYSQLLIDLASRAYELEKGRSPTNLNELVPDYLKRMPKQPGAERR